MGAKASGASRLDGDLGITEVAPKTIVVDSFARLKQLWWYPYTERLTKGTDASSTCSMGAGGFRGSAGRPRGAAPRLQGVMLAFGRTPVPAGGES